MDHLTANFHREWERLFEHVEVGVRKHISEKITLQKPKDQSDFAVEADPIIELWQSIEQIPISAVSPSTAAKLARQALDSLEKYSGVVLKKSRGRLEDLSWACISRVCIMLHLALSEHLIRSSYDYTDSFYYWNAMASSRRMLFSYGIATLPRRALNYMRDHGSLTSLTSLSTLFRNPLWAQMQIHGEVKMRRDLVSIYRRELAVMVGLLFEEKPFPADTKEKSKDVRRKTSHSLTVLLHCLEVLIERFAPFDSSLFSSADLQEVHDEQQTPTSSSFPPPPTTTLLKQAVSQDMIDEIQSRTRNQTEYSINDAFASIKLCVEKFVNATDSVSNVSQSLSKPSRFERYWPQYAFSAILFGGVCVSLVNNREQLIEMMWNIGDTAYKFIMDWIYEPIANIYRTIRHENNVQLTSGARGLNADLESLERMVLDYAKETRALPSEELQLLASSVKQGDLTVIMKDYENDIKHPVRNILQGQMLRTLFIQAHKAKVDLEIAMQGIDQMLRAQELNFAFLAVAPTLIVTGATYNYIWRKSANWNERSRKVVVDGLVNVEKLLIMEWGKPKLSYSVNGQVIIETYYTISKLLRTSALNSKRQRILDDLNELTNDLLSPEMKYRLVHRILRETTKQ